MLGKSINRSEEGNEEGKQYLEIVLGLESYLKIGRVQVPQTLDNT